MPPGVSQPEDRFFVSKIDGSNGERRSLALIGLGDHLLAVLFTPEITKYDPRVSQSGHRFPVAEDLRGSAELEAAEAAIGRIRRAAGSDWRRDPIETQKSKVESNRTESNQVGSRRNSGQASSDILAEIVPIFLSESEDPSRGKAEESEKRCESAHFSLKRDAFGVLP
jgi:hypothetical protein